jgi:hypothetical protein
MDFRGIPICTERKPIEPVPITSPIQHPDLTIVDVEGRKVHKIIRSDNLDHFVCYYVCANCKSNVMITVNKDADPPYRYEDINFIG